MATVITRRDNDKVTRKGIEIGEFAPVDFMKRVETGKIWPDDWFWTLGMSEWKRVSELKILEKRDKRHRPFRLFRRFRLNFFGAEGTRSEIAVINKLSPPHSRK